MEKMERKGKVCLITGATSGIGKETAKSMAAGGFTLVLLVRDSMKGDLLVEELKALYPEATVDIMHCNLASFASIRGFASKFKSRYNRLDVLINNAGVWETKRNLSEDGIEMNFAVNHLAPFLLTNLLIDVMKSSAPARIINVASEAHKYGSIYFDDPEFEKKYSMVKSYAQSKLANILITKKLSQQLRGSGVTVNCLHPGFVKTRLFEKMPRVITGLLTPFMISAERGSQTTLFLATSPEVGGVSGEYFVKSKSVQPRPEALRQDIADRLWELSMNYTGL